MWKRCLGVTAAIWAVSLTATACMAEQPRVARVSVLVGSLLADEAGPASAKSPLRSPFGVDFDRAGNMFIVELEGGRVHERTADGRLTVIAGDGSKGYQGDGGPAKAATFNGMHNVAVTKAGGLYIADSWNHCVRMIDLKSRTISTAAGTGKPGADGDGGPAEQASFDFLMCVTLNHAEDTLYLTDLKNGRIRALDLKSNIVRNVAGNGNKGVPRDGASAVESPLVDPRAAASDSKENVYILERGGHALRVVDRDGKIRTVAGTGQKGFCDGKALEAQLGAPKHVCVDDEDRVYVADDANAAVRCYDPETGTVSTVLGRGHGAEKIKLLRPHGVCIEKGELIVVDTGHDRILRVEFAGGTHGGE